MHIKFQEETNIIILSGYQGEIDDVKKDKSPSVFSTIIELVRDKNKP